LYENEYWLQLLVPVPGLRDCYQIYKRKKYRHESYCSKSDPAWEPDWPGIYTREQAEFLMAGNEFEKVNQLTALMRYNIITEG
jgi:hypothetical protein